jgi:hypothetical protein
MTFETSGFLSPLVTQFRQSTRSAEEFKRVFSFADQLNRLCLDFIFSMKVNGDDPQQFAGTLVFVRAYQSYQASIILSEHGLIGDARGVVRSCVESAIACCAIQEDADFPKKIISAYHAHRRTIANEQLNDSDLSALLSPAESQIWKNVIAEVSAIVPRPQSINWRDVAFKHCKMLYSTLYRIMSSDGAHATAESLERHIVTSKEDRSIELECGPVTNGLVDTISAACLAMLWALTASATTFERQDIRNRTDELLRRYDEILPPLKQSVER